MINFDHIDVFNFENAIRGCRNALESWNKSDSGFIADTVYPQRERFVIGVKDLDLAQRLIKAGVPDSKFLRQVFVSIDVTAPLYWWKECDTYKIGTVANSTSTMHKLGSRDLNFSDFSWDKLTPFRKKYLEHINSLIEIWRNDKSEENFRMMIQDLLDSYMQTRTWTANYQVLRNIYFSRRNHKLNEWREFCKLIETLPYGKDLICFE